jgi:RNA polymerase sigma factor (sigma-70 family)
MADHDPKTASEVLLARYQAGDESALSRLWERFRPRLGRWASGRLPPLSRSLASTDDLVQDTFLRSLDYLQTIQPQGPRSLFAYFRKTVLNQIRDQARRSAVRPRAVPLSEELHSSVGPSPLEELLGREVLDRYEQALATLSEDDQAIVVAFVELRCTDREIAELCEKPSPDAARMARNRAVARLARALSRPPASGATAPRR